MKRRGKKESLQENPLARVSWARGIDKRAEREKTGAQI